MERFKTEDSDEDHQLVQVVGLDTRISRYSTEGRQPSHLSMKGAGTQTAKRSDAVKAVIMNNRVMSAAPGVTGQGVVALYNHGLFPQKTTASKSTKKNYLFRHVQKRSKLYDVQSSSTPPLPGLDRTGDVVIKFQNKIFSEQIDINEVQPERKGKKRVRRSREKVKDLGADQFTIEKVLLNNQSGEFQKRGLTQEEAREMASTRQKLRNSTRLLLLEEHPLNLPSTDTAFAQEVETGKIPTYFRHEKSSDDFEYSAQDFRDSKLAIVHPSEPKMTGELYSEKSAEDLTSQDLKNILRASNSSHLSGNINVPKQKPAVIKNHSQNSINSDQVGPSYVNQVEDNYKINKCQPLTSKSSKQGSIAFSTEGIFQSRKLVGSKHSPGVSERGTKSNLAVKSVATLTTGLRADMTIVNSDLDESAHHENILPSFQSLKKQYFNQNSVQDLFNPEFRVASGFAQVTKNGSLQESSPKGTLDKSIEARFKFTKQSSSYSTNMQVVIIKPPENSKSVPSTKMNQEQQNVIYANQGFSKMAAGLSQTRLDQASEKSTIRRKSSDENGRRISPAKDSRLDFPSDFQRNSVPPPELDINILLDDLPSASELKSKMSIPLGQSKPTSIMNIAEDVEVKDFTPKIACTIEKNEVQTDRFNGHLYFPANELGSEAIFAPKILSQGATQRVDDKITDPHIISHATLGGIKQRESRLKFPKKSRKSINSLGSGTKVNSEKSGSPRIDVAKIVYKRGDAAVRILEDFMEQQRIGSDHKSDAILKDFNHQCDVKSLSNETSQSGLNPSHQTNLVIPTRGKTPKMDFKVKNNRTKFCTKKRARTADSRQGRQNLGQMINEQKNILQHMHTETRGDKKQLKHLKQDEIIKLNTKKPVLQTDQKLYKTQQFFAQQKETLLRKSASNLMIQGDQIESIASKERRKFFATMQRFAMEHSHSDHYLHNGSSQPSGVIMTTVPIRSNDNKNQLLYFVTPVGTNVHPNLRSISPPSRDMSPCIDRAGNNTTVQPENAEGPIVLQSIYAAENTLNNSPVKRSRPEPRDFENESFITNNTLLLNKREESKSIQQSPGEANFTQESKLEEHPINQSNVESPKKSNPTSKVQSSQRLYQVRESFDSTEKKSSHNVRRIKSTNSQLKVLSTCLIEDQKRFRRVSPEEELILELKSENRMTGETGLQSIQCDSDLQINREVQCSEPDELSLVAERDYKPLEVQVCLCEKKKCRRVYDRMKADRQSVDSKATELIGSQFVFLKSLQRNEFSSIYSTERHEPQKASAATQVMDASFGNHSEDPCSHKALKPRFETKDDLTFLEPQQKVASFLSKEFVQSYDDDSRKIAMSKSNVFASLGKQLQHVAPKSLAAFAGSGMGPDYLGGTGQQPPFRQFVASANSQSNHILFNGQMRQEPKEDLEAFKVKARNANRLKSVTQQIASNGYRSNVHSSTEVFDVDHQQKLMIANRSNRLNSRQVGNLKATLKTDVGYVTVKSCQQVALATDIKSHLMYRPSAKFYKKPPRPQTGKAQTQIHQVNLVDRDDFRYESSCQHEMEEDFGSQNTESQVQMPRTLENDALIEEITEAKARSQANIKRDVRTNDNYKQEDCLHHNFSRSTNLQNCYSQQSASNKAFQNRAELPLIGPGSVSAVFPNNANQYLAARATRPLTAKVQRSNYNPRIAQTNSNNQSSSFQPMTKKGSKNCTIQTAKDAVGRNLGQNSTSGVTLTLSHKDQQKQQPSITNGSVVTSIVSKRVNRIEPPTMVTTNTKLVKGLAEISYMPGQVPQNYQVNVISQESLLGAFKPGGLLHVKQIQRNPFPDFKNRKNFTIWQSAGDQGPQLNSDI